MAARQVNILVVEDSRVARMVLVQLLKADPQIHVSGVAASGRKALEFLAKKSVDVVLMDVHMPEMDGLQTARRIMETNPVPIVICSAIANVRETISNYRLMEVGAVAFVDKPVAPSDPAFGAMADYLRQTVKLMSEIKVVRRWPLLRSDSTAVPLPPLSTIGKSSRATKLDIIGVGASTGGPPVLQIILSGLANDLSVPVLVVQHIAPGFVASLADWLTRTTGLTVEVAVHGAKPLPRHIYLAPDDCHMEVGKNRQIVLNNNPVTSGPQPSVGRLFRSLANVYADASAGVLLTGMGKDGADDLKYMKDKGALTIAQDRATCVVFGMPGEAIAQGAATYVLPPERIAPALLANVNNRQATFGERS